MKHVRSILLALAGATALPLPVAAQELVVTRMDDPAPNGCPPGDCSLREAVIAANVDPAGYNNIRLPAGTYQVNATPLAITGGTKIIGAGSTQTLIRGDGVTDVMTFSGPHQFDLNELAIDARGRTEFSTVNNNRIGIYRVRAPNPQGLIDVRDPNNAGLGDFFIGESEIAARVVSGGKHSFSLFNSRIARLAVWGGELSESFRWHISLDDVVVDGALAGAESSGIEITTAGGVQMKRVTIQNTRDGAYIQPSMLGHGEFDIDRLRYLDNARPLAIAGMEGRIDRSEFLRNINDDPGIKEPGALLVDSDAAVTINGSTFSGNRGSASAGGAILIEGEAPSLLVRNSTFSSNSISVAAAGLPGGARGGAIGWASNASGFSLVLRHVTVAAPSILPVGLSGSAIGGHGPASNGDVRIYNSIVRGSCSFAAGSIDSGAGNIESTGNTCGLSSPSNQTTVSAASLALGPLGMHGGHTASIEPGPASAARDRANALFCLDDDQRGYPRPFGAGCDVGAVEVGDVIFIDGFE